MPMTDQEIAELVERRLDLLAELDKIKLRIADTDAELAPALAERGGRFELPGLPGQGFILASSTTFSAARFREMVGEKRYAEVCIFPPGSKGEAAQVAPGAIVEQCMVPGKASVRRLPARGRNA